MPNVPKSLEICQSGKIVPNLVTLRLPNSSSEENCKLTKCQSYKAFYTRNLQLLSQTDYKIAHITTLEL